MQTQGHGTYDILPVAAPIERQPDHAKMLVMIHRDSDPKVRRDGRTPARRTAKAGAKNTVDERGEVHGAFRPQKPTRSGPRPTLTLKSTPTLLWRNST